MSTPQRQLLALVLALALVGYSPKAQAASAFAGALEPTQVANFIQLIQQAVKLGQQVRKTVQLVKYWKQNLEGFDRGLRLATLTAAFNDVSGIYAEYRQLTFGRDSNVETFRKKYPGYKDPPDQNYAKAYRDVDRATLASAERGLKQFDIQLTDKDGGIKAEAELLKQLAARADSADGVVKALGVTNDVLLHISQQVQKLQLAMTAHGQTMAHFVAGEVQRRSYQEHARDRYFEFREEHPPEPVDWSREGSRGLL